jgi:hypothetical protein
MWVSRFLVALLNIETYAAKTLDKSAVFPMEILDDSAGESIPNKREQRSNACALDEHGLL